MHKEKQSFKKILKNSVITTAAVVFAAGGGTPAAAKALPASVSFSMEEAITHFYGNEAFNNVEETGELNIGLNTVEGEKGFDQHESELTYTISDLFHLEDTSYINEASGDLVLSVSDAEVVSVEENTKTSEKTVTAKNEASQQKVSLYGQSKGAAVVYLNEVEGDTVTTLGTVEVEVR
ncbi:hypothetical protein [Salibacterium aidingense]|uniref:hypothetical protein n=1 Tax=Salibacterium aidingense TaxID=384933 RepID=UPI003BE18082